jgi:hypothetical protein
MIKSGWVAEPEMPVPPHRVESTLQVTWALKFGFSRSRRQSHDPMQLRKLRRQIIYLLVTVHS